MVSTSLVVLQLQELWLLRLGPEPSRSISWAAAQQLLWSGVPIVTLAGRGMAARVGASVLTAHAAGVTLARNAEDMEALARRLLTSSTRLRRVRLLLDTHRQTPVHEPQ